MPITVRMSGPDYIVEVQGVSVPQPPPESGKTLRGRPWLAVHWRCCSVYSRVYRDPSGKSYDGRCPVCRRPIHLKVGAGGTNCRFFEAG